MNLKHLETFILVAELQSFTAAARKLYMSQPAVSFQIKSLEEDLQVTLFQRGDKRLGLTAAGKILYPEAKKMVLRYQKIKSGIDDLKGLKSGHLVVGASTTPGEYLVPLMIGEFRRLYPGVGVSLQVAGSGQVFRWVKDREIDVGVTGSAASGNWLWCERWIEDDLALIVPPEHPWAKRDDIDKEELLAEPLILREPGSGTRRSFEQKIVEAGLDPARINLAMELGSTRAIITAVQAGLGVSVVSVWAARDALDLGKIKRVTPPVDMKRYLYLVGSRQAADSPVIEEFLVLLRTKSADQGGSPEKFLKT
ncbi:MAG: selenium metabolism-associated LysR family transcriptional regulator [Bacillota bacterium]